MDFARFDFFSINSFCRRANLFGTMWILLGQSDIMWLAKQLFRVAFGALLSGDVLRR